MDREDRVIDKCKKFHYAFFWNNSKFWGILLFFLGITPFYEFVKFIPFSNELFMAICVLLSIISYFSYDKLRERGNVAPFKTSRNFVGIYTIEDLNGRNSEFYNEKLISRIHEVEYLKDILNKIFLQSDEKQSICIIGESGSGKSTIINCLQNELSDVNVINCSDRYKDLKRFLLKRLKKETLEELFFELQNTTQKILFIFDQFERFFYLDYHEQEMLKNIILNKLNFKNVASIFILRSDYFAEFAYSVNINDITDNVINPKGILANPFGKNWYSHNYLIYCKNMVDEDFPRNYSVKQEDIIENRNDDIYVLCRLAFDSMGNEVYERFKDKRLIEKQVFLSLLESKYTSCNFEELFRTNNDRDLLVMYYDKQLCSTGDYYTAAKIMYLLSTGRIYNNHYSVQMIYEALLVCRDFEISNVNKIIECLCERHLIKSVQRDDINYYDIVHDYIAESFIEYVEVDLHEYVKSTIDDYRVNFKTKEYKDNIKKCLELKKSSKYFETVILALVISVITFNSFYQVFYLNRDYNIIVNFPLYMASYYGYCLYTNIFKVYIGKNKWVISLLYIGMALCTIMASFQYKNWLFFAGIGTMLIGLAFGVIRQSKKMSRVAKKFYTDFFGKVTATGFVITVTSIIFAITNTNFYIGIVIIFAELLYAYIAQLSEEYYYYCVGLMNSK